MNRDFQPALQSAPPGANWTAAVAAACTPDDLPAIRPEYRLSSLWSETPHLDRKTKSPAIVDGVYHFLDHIIDDLVDGDLFSR